MRATRPPERVPDLAGPGPAPPRGRLVRFPLARKACVDAGSGHRRGRMRLGLESAGCEVARRGRRHSTSLWCARSGAAVSAPRVQAQVRPNCIPTDGARRRSGAIAAAAGRGSACRPSTTSAHWTAWLRSAPASPRPGAGWTCCSARSAASPAWPLEDEFPRQVGDRPGHGMAQNIFATWVNAVGYPGLNVPCAPPCGWPAARRSGRGPLRGRQHGAGGRARAGR